MDSGSISEREDDFLRADQGSFVTGNKSIVFKFADVEVREREFRLVKGGNVLPVEPKTFRVLLFLLRNPQKLIAKEELLNAVWGDAAVTDSSLTRTIAQLRRLLGDEIRSPRYIETVATVGYRFLCEVDVSETGEHGRASIIITTPTSTVPSAADRVETSPASVTKRWRAAGIGISVGVLIVLLAVGAGVLRIRQRRGQSPVESLAVLPFTTSPKQDLDEYLADGITEGVINDLSQVSALRVMSRSTVFRFKGKESDPQRVGATLNVDAVVTGHIVQQGDNLTIQAEIVRVSDGTQIWGQQFTRKMKDVSFLHGDIGREIASRLRVQLSGEEKQRMMGPGTQNQEAYQCYLRGRFFFAQRTESGLRQAIENFQHTVTLDPSFAQAYASLALAYNVGRSYLPAEESRTLHNGKAEAERAVQLNPRLSEVHVALAVVNANTFDWASAEREFKIALEINPNDANAHYFYAKDYLLPHTRFDEATAEYRKALQLDPLSEVINANLGVALMIARRFDEAGEQFRKTLALDPKFEIASERYAELEAYLGNYSGAQELRIAFCPEDAKLDFGTGKEAYYRTDLKSSCRRLAWRFALDYAMLGRKDEAFRELNHFLEDDPTGANWYIQRPEYDSLRSDPRYAEVLRRIDLPQ